MAPALYLTKWLLFITNNATRAHTDFRLQNTEDGVLTHKMKVKDVKVMWVFNRRCFLDNVGLTCGGGRVR